MDERPFAKRQVTSDEDIVPLTSFYLFMKCCAASSVVIEGIKGIKKCIYSKKIALRQMNWRIPVERLQSLVVGCFGDYLEFLLHWKTYFVRNGQKMKSIITWQVTSYFNMQEIRTTFLYLEYGKKPLNIHNLFLCQTKYKWAFNFSPLTTFVSSYRTGKRDGHG